MSYAIARKYGIYVVPNMSLFVAKIIGVIGDFVGSKFPLNSEKIQKITSDLTFDDSKAQIDFGWNPTSVLEHYKNEVL